MGKAIDTRHVRSVCVALFVFGAAGAASAQTPAATGAGARTITVGILPFTDATASGNRSIGADIGRTMQAEMVHATSLMPRLLTVDGTAGANPLDGEQAVALARAQGLDQVFLGTVLEARSEESNRSGWIPSIKGQSASVRLRRVKATVTLQGELYDVATGARIFSVRVTGKDSNNAFGGTAYTSFGAVGNDGYSGLMESPLGKALQSAVADMTRKVSKAKGTGKTAS